MVTYSATKTRLNFGSILVLYRDDLTPKQLKATYSMTRVLTRT